MTVVNQVSTRKPVNWKQVGVFLAVTFGGAWLLDLVLFLTGGIGFAIAHPPVDNADDHPGICRDPARNFLFSRELALLSSM